RAIWALSALRTSGRLSQRCRTGPRRSSLMWEVCGSSGICRLLLGSVRRAGERPHELADDGQHDLVGAAANGGETAVAESAAHWRLVHEAHAAVVLEAGVADLAAHAPGFELGHGGEAGHVGAGDVEFASAIDQRAQQLDLGRKLRQTEMH